MPSTSLQPILDAALADYAKQTGVDPAKHPFSDQLHTCHSSNDVLKLIEDKLNEFKDYREGNRKLINCLQPVVKVVHAFSDVLGEVVSFARLKIHVLPIHIFTALLLGTSTIPTSEGNIRWHKCSPCSMNPLTFSAYMTS